MNCEGGSATSKADGTYDIDGLVAGLYHVTPALAGYTFSPSSRPVLVGPDAASISFTARVLPPPPALSSIKLRPAAVKQGRRVTVTVTLTAATRSSITVALASADANAAPVPGSVEVLPGNRSASFSFIAGHVAKATPVAVSATYNSVRKSASLSVKP